MVLPGPLVFKARLVRLVFREPRWSHVLMALPEPRAPLAWRDLMVQQVLQALTGQPALSALLAPLAFKVLLALLASAEPRALLVPRVLSASAGLQGQQALLVSMV